MRRNVQEQLSYILKVDGEIVPAMPDDGEFSVQEVRDYVAGNPAVACETQDGYVLFHNKDAESTGGTRNALASEICAEGNLAHVIKGRAFLAHPQHVPAFWKELAKDPEMSKNS